MYREYDKTLDGNGALRSGHMTIKGLLVDASNALSAGCFEQLIDIYDRISSLGSSLRESAEMRVTMTTNYKSREEE